MLSPVEIRGLRGSFYVHTLSISLKRKIILMVEVLPVLRYRTGNILFHITKMCAKFWRTFESFLKELWTDICAIKNKLINPSPITGVKVRITAVFFMQIIRVSIPRVDIHVCITRVSITIFNVSVRIAKVCVPITRVIIPIKRVGIYPSLGSV